MITNEEKWIRRNQTDCFDWVGSVYLVTIFLPTCIADRWKILDIWSRRKRSPDQSCQTFQCLRIEDIVASGWGRVGHVVFFRSPALLYIRMAQRGASVSLKTCSHTVQTLNRPQLPEAVRARGICGHARAWNLELGGVEVSQGSREYNSNVLLKRRIMANTWFCFLCLIWRFDEERVSTNDTKRGATGKNLRTSALGVYADTLYTKWLQELLAPVGALRFYFKGTLLENLREV